MQNGQIHLNNSSAIYRQIVQVCLTILWDWCLKGYKAMWQAVFERSFERSWGKHVFERSFSIVPT